MNDYSQPYAENLKYIPPNSTLHAIIDGRFYIDQLLMGVDEAAGMIILAEKSNPAKVKPYSSKKINLLNEVDMEACFNRQLTPAPTAVVATSRGWGGWYGNLGNNIEEGDGAGFEVPPGFGRTDLPYQEDKWHPPGCRCNPSKMITFTQTCTGFGGWNKGDPVYP
jgi:hypothetical protein